MEKYTSKIARYFLLGVVFTKLLSLLSDMLLAWRHGAGAVSDAFIVAQAVPTLLLAAPAIAVTVNLPRLFYQQESLNPDEQNHFTSALLNVLLALAIVFGVAVFFFPGYVVKAFAFGFDEKTALLALDFTKIITFAVVPIALAAALKGFLHSKNKLPVFLTESVIISLSMSVGILLSSEKNSMILAWAALAGAVIATAFTLVFAIKNGYRYKVAFAVYREKTKTFAAMSAPVLLFYFSYEIIHFFDRTFASTVGEGVVSSLRYAQKLQSIIVVLVFFFIYSVLFPLLSKSFAEEKIDSFRQSVRSTFTIALLWTFPFIVFLVTLSSPVIRLFFQHGAFDGMALMSTAELFTGYAVIILPLSFRLLLDNTFFVIRDIKTPVITSLITMAINVGLDFLLVPFFGKMGIVLAALVAVTVHVVILFVLLRSRIGSFGLRGIVKNFLKLLLAAGPVGLTMLLIFTFTFYSMRPTLSHLLTILFILFVLNFIAFRLLMRLLHIEGFHYLYLYRDRLKAMFRPMQAQTHSRELLLQPVSMYVTGNETYFDRIYDYESMLRGNERTAELFEEEAAENFLGWQVDLEADEEALDSELAAIKNRLMPPALQRLAKRQYRVNKRRLQNRIQKAVAAHKKSQDIPKEHQPMQSMQSGVSHRALAKKYRNNRYHFKKRYAPDLSAKNNKHRLQNRIQKAVAAYKKSHLMPTKELQPMQSGTRRDQAKRYRNNRYRFKNRYAPHLSAKNNAAQGERAEGNAEFLMSMPKIDSITFSDEVETIAQSYQEEKAGNIWKIKQNHQVKKAMSVLKKTKGKFLTALERFLGMPDENGYDEKNKKKSKNNDNEI